MPNETIAETEATKAGHTPGDWKWVNFPDGRKLLAAPDCAVIHCPDAAFSITEADQALIAAAPDLLAAAKFAASVLLANGLIELSEDTAHYKLEKAIEKAEGRS